MEENMKSIFEERTITRNGKIMNNYSITPYGVVINKTTRNVLKSREMHNSHGSHLQGYQIFDVYDDDHHKCTMLKHRAVAEAYIPNPNNLPTVNHKNGDKSNNYYNNLEWASYLDNNIHAIETGLTHRVACENHQNATLTNIEVEHICELLEQGYMYSDIVSTLHLNHIKNIESKIKMIKTRNAWTQISCRYNLPMETNKPHVYEVSLIHKICKYLEDYGFTSNDEILDYIGINDKNKAMRNLVYSIRTRKKYKSISNQYKF